MLQLIPAPLHRLLYRMADRLRRRWWRFRKPRRSSVLVVAFDDAGRVLLVRHSYGPPVWALPGGGVARDEDPAPAAEREVREELGCGLTDLISIEAREHLEYGSRDLRHVFAASLSGVPVPDMREIVEAGLFDPVALPVPCDRRVGPAVTAAREARSQQR
jgi:8-oxo-dGTP pyrophosphatase MutT (NUDIX family)